MLGNGENCRSVSQKPNMKSWNVLFFSKPKVIQDFRKYSLLRSWDQRILTFFFFYSSSLLIIKIVDSSVNRLIDAALVYIVSLTTDLNKVNIGPILIWYICCLIIRANKATKHVSCCQMTLKLWRQCFHGRADDERDTWCHDVGAKCHCHLQAHQIWQMAICSLWQLVLLHQKIFEIHIFSRVFVQVCVCFVNLSSNIIQLSSIICVCVCTAEVSLRGWTDSRADRGQLLASGGTSPSLTPQRPQVIHTNPHYYPQFY